MSRIIGIVFCSIFLFVMAGCCNGGAVKNVSKVAEKGKFFVILDASSPDYRIIAGGTEDNVMAVLRVSAINEPISLRSISLSYTTGIDSITLWDGNDLIGQRMWLSHSSSKRVGISLRKEFVIPKDGAKLLTVKANAMPRTVDFMKIDYDFYKLSNDSSGPFSNALADTLGVGIDSGEYIECSSKEKTDSDGARVVRSSPMFYKLPIPTNTLSYGYNVLYRFGVKIDNSDYYGNVGIHQLAVGISIKKGSGISVSNLNIYAYDNSSFSMPIYGIGPSGNMSAEGITIEQSGIFPIVAQNHDGDDTLISIGAIRGRCFEVRADLSGISYDSQIGDAIIVSLPEDEDIGTEMLSAEDVKNSGSYFIWSPFSTGFPSKLSDEDWTNGYGVKGL